MSVGLIKIAGDVARKAGKHIARSFDRLDTINIEYKSHNDIVTDADLAAENIICEEIEKLCPGHLIIAEERGGDQSAMHGDTPVWIIDPLDGTNNFAHGLPHFCISIAIMEQSKITHAVIYDPMRDELFTALRGKGAQLNAKRIRVTERPTLEQSLLGTGFPFRNKELLPTYLKTFEPLAQRSAGLRRMGSAALDLAYVAAGRMDGFWEFGLNCWDTAAGALLVREAGGLVTDFAGSEMDFLNNGNIVAGNRKVFKELLQVINQSTRE